MKSSARDLLINEILEASENLGHVRLWKAQTGVVQTSSGNFVRSGPRGAAPITGIAPKGVRLEIEVANEGLAATPSQKSFEHFIRKFGGQYLFCSSLEEALAFLRGF
jgi:hypothetical protein